MCSTALSTCSEAQGTNPQEASFIHASQYRSRNRYFRVRDVTSLLDCVSAVTLCHYLLMKHYLEMREGKPNAPICNILL